MEIIEFFYNVLREIKFCQICPQQFHKLIKSFSFYSLKLVSRKILSTENFCDFHTVPLFRKYYKYSPFPLGTTGLSRWSCLDTGLWSDNHPDMSDCKSEAATNLEARVRAEDPEAVLASSLAHMTSSSKSHFYGGDLDTSVAVMRTIGNRLRFILQTGLHGRGGGHARGQIYNKEAFVQEVAANVIRTVSNLIADDKVLAWMDLKVPLRMKMMNHLLLALEEVAFMLAEVTETPELLEEASENLCKYFLQLLSNYC